MNNNITFNDIMAIIEQGKIEIKDSLYEHDYEALNNAYATGNSVAVYIDVDYARSYRHTGIRGQLYEAAQMFRRAGGKVYAMTSQTMAYFKDGNASAFTDVYCGPEFDEETMARQIRSDMKMMICCSTFVFGGETLYNNIKDKLNKDDMCASVVGTQMLEINENKFPLRNYTVVEYILFYLTIKISTKNI